MAHLHEASRIGKTNAEAESFSHQNSFVIRNRLTPVRAYSVASITPVIICTAHEELCSSEANTKNCTSFLKLKWTLLIVVTDHVRVRVQVAGPDSCLR